MLNFDLIFDKKIYFAHTVALIDVGDAFWLLSLAWFFLLMLLDFVYYYLWILFSYLKPKKLIYENKNLFYIYLKIIPFVSSLTVFIWTFLSEKRNFKKDFLKIFVWNMILIIFSYFVFLFLSFFYCEFWFDVNNSICHF